VGERKRTVQTYIPAIRGRLYRVGNGRGDSHAGNPNLLITEQ